MFGHTQIVWISLVVETLLFVGVFVILLPTKNLFACWKLWGGGYNVQNGQLLVLLSNLFGGWIEKNTNLDDYLYWRFYTRSRLSTGRGRQFRFAFIHKANIRCRWSMIRESADTTQKGIGALAKNWRLFSYDNEMLFGQGYPCCLKVVRRIFYCRYENKMVDYWVLMLGG